MKHAQEIFALGRWGRVEHASAGAPFVVEEGERHRAGRRRPSSTKSKFTESDGPSYQWCSSAILVAELTYVHSVGKDMAMKKGSDQLVRTPRP